jgi:hypothetical protein
MLTKREFAAAAFVGLAMAVLVSNHANPPRPMRPGEYTADQITVLDAFGATAAMVKAARRDGRTPICWVSGPDREKALQLCAEKGFNVYAAAVGSGGN